MRMTQSLIGAVAAATMVAGVPSAQAAESVQPAESVPAAQPVQAQKSKQQSWTQTKKAGRKAIRSALKDAKGTSASVALVSGGKTVWGQTFGRVNTAGKKPSPTTKFGIGSVNKMLTTMAVMQ